MNSESGARVCKVQRSIRDMCRTSSGKGGGCQPLSLLLHPESSAQPESAEFVPMASEAPLRRVECPVVDSKASATRPCIIPEACLKPASS